MHSREPPVIHRDLKCDNLFIDASEGIVKIGDFGLSRSVPNGEAESKLGTPAYTAPEVYNGKYTTKADIWSFGLCVLEMVTGESPYSECPTVGAIYMKVSSGGLPAALSQVGDPVIADFVTICLLPAELRPAAASLLGHDLIVEFDKKEDVDEEVVVVQQEEKFVEPVGQPEYDALVKRQAEEIELLKRAQFTERHAMRATIRSSAKM
jgi:WNK lysine deficient protein kinase